MSIKHKSGLKLSWNNSSGIYFVQFITNAAAIFPTPTYKFNVLKDLRPNYNFTTLTRTPLPLVSIYYFAETFSIFKFKGE